jgi:uncharacterized membrane protein YphA (DoxX/SURF4 family)
MTASPVLLCARLALAALFLVAGSAKLSRRAETKAAAGELGLPERAAAVAAPVLPVLELALAAALTADRTARPAAGAALLLAACFILLSGRALIRGQRPRCRCFGELLHVRIGYGTFALDAGMAAIAAAIAARGPGAAVPVHGSRATLLLLCAAVCVAAPVLASLRAGTADLRRRCGTLETRLRTLEAAARLGADGAAPVGGPEAGAPAPMLRVADIDARELSLRPRAAHDLLLLFLEPGCDPCARVLAEAARWQHVAESRLTFWFVYGETPEEAARMAREYGLENVYAQPGRQASDSYRIPGTPSGVLIDGGGQVTVPLAAGYGAIHDLVARYVAADAAPLPPALVGQGRRITV